MKPKAVIWGSYVAAGLLANLLIFYFLNQLMLAGAVSVYAVIILLPIVFFIVLFKSGQLENRANLVWISLIMALCNILFYSVFSNLLLDPAQVEELTRRLSQYNSQGMEISLSVSGVKPVLTIGIVNFLSVMLIGYVLMKRKEVR